MIRIALCEDENILRKHCKEHLDKYFTYCEEPYVIDEYDKGSKLLVSQPHCYDLLIMDVSLGETLDGIEVAQIYRQKGYLGEVIFLTSHKQEAHRAFDVEAFRYFIKPIDAQNFYKGLDKVVERIKRNTKNQVVVKNKDGQMYLKPEEVIYIETIGHKQHVHTPKGTIEINSTMKELEELFKDNHFFRIHASYLIHLRYVKSHTKDTVVMENSEALALSRLRSKSFKEAMIEYLRDTL